MNSFCHKPPISRSNIGISKTGTPWNNYLGSFGVSVFMSVLLAGTSIGVAQEKYMPPTYRETINGPERVTTWTPVDQMFDAGSGSAPLEPDHPFFDVDWSLLLSGTHTGGSDTGKNAATITPEISLTHMGLRSQYAFDAKASISATDSQMTRLNNSEFGLAGTYEADKDTQLNYSARLQYSQDDINSPGVSDTITQLPHETMVQGELGIVRQFGKFGVDVRLQTERLHFSDTQLVGNLARNNDERSFTEFGGSLRTSYAFSPEISLFVQGDVSRDWYFGAPASTGVKLDGTDYGISVGGSVNWRNVLDLELTAGYVLRQHVATTIADRGEAVYGVNIDYTPNDALSFSGTIGTIIKPKDVTLARQASIEYNASGSISYAVAPWLGLRATQTGRWVFPEIGVDTATYFGSGFGVDIAVNKNMAINLDYLYSWAEVLPTTLDPVYQHAATIGVRFSR